MLCIILFMLFYIVCILQLCILIFADVYIRRMVESGENGHFQFVCIFSMVPSYESIDNSTAFEYRGLF